MSSEKLITVNIVDQDGGRRNFLKNVGGIFGGLVLVGSAGSLLEACAGNTSSPTGIGTPNTAASIMVDVATLDADGKALVTTDRDPDGATIIVHRVSTGVFESHSMKCTHAGCNVNPPSSVGGVQLMQCPCHASNYTLSGVVQIGPATENLKSFVTTYDAAMNMVTIKFK